MNAPPIPPGFTVQILRLTLLAGVVLTVASPVIAGEKIIFSGRFEKRGLPDLTDRERLLPEAISRFPQANAPGPDFAIPQPSTTSTTLTRRQQEAIDQRRNWIEHGQKRNGDPGTENPNTRDQPGDRDSLNNNSGERTASKPEAKRAASPFNPRESGANRFGFNSAATSRDDDGRSGNPSGTAGNDPVARGRNSGVRLPGEMATELRGGVDLPATRLAPRLGLGVDNPIQQKMDRDSQFRQLLDPKVGDAARGNDFLSMSPELTRQQQQQTMGRAFEDILRRPEPIRSFDSLRPKVPVGGVSVGADAPKSGNLADFSRIMAPAPVPERPRPSVTPTEFPKRAF